jgi:hypothetical protein
MRSNERLQRVLAVRQLGGMKGASLACPAVDAPAGLFNDIRLFALTFAGGFLFTTIFIA